jgi:hypothetical protein
MSGQYDRKVLQNASPSFLIVFSYVILSQLKRKAKAGHSGNSKIQRLVLDSTQEYV